MQNLIQNIVSQLDQTFLETEFSKIRDIKLDMQDIEQSIQGLRSEVTLWDRLNPFSHDEGKQELKYHKGELKFYKKEYNSITDVIRNHIRHIIEINPSLKMKAKIADLDLALRSLRSKLRLNSSRNNNRGRQGRLDQIHHLQSGLRELDDLLYKQFGFEAGILNEKEMVNLVLEDLLRKQMV